MATGPGLGGVGAATVAAAQVGEFPSYHGCPGKDWHPDWGNNCDAGACHDHAHRDIDGDDHHCDGDGDGDGENHDYWG
jgi:hypothetical protein